MLKRTILTANSLFKPQTRTIQKPTLLNTTRREIHFQEIYPLKDQAKKTQAVLIKIAVVDDADTKENRKVLLKKNREIFLKTIKEYDLKTGVGYLFLGTCQTVISVPDENKVRRVLGPTHIAGALFTPDMKIKDGTGANKRYRINGVNMSKNAIIPGIEGEIYQQNFQANAAFHDDTKIEDYLLRSLFNNIPPGGACYVGILAQEKTNLDENLVKDRIIHEKKYDGIYDRQLNACGHHVERAYIGKEIGNKSLQTQTAFINTFIELTQDDPTLTENFLEAANRSHLAKLGQELGEEYSLKNKQVKQNVSDSTEQSSFTLRR